MLKGARVQGMEHSSGGQGLCQRVLSEGTHPWQTVANMSAYRASISQLWCSGWWRLRDLCAALASVPCSLVWRFRIRSPDGDCLG